MFWMLKNFLPKFKFYMADDDLAGSLLDYDPEEEVSSEGGENPPKKSQESKNKSDDRIAKLEKRLKDSQEFIRQQGETIKGLENFKKRLTEEPEDEKKKREELELRSRFDDDPISAMDEMIERKMDKKLSGMKDLEEKVDLNSTTNTVRDAMRQIEKDYEIDWDKHSKKVIAELDNVSEDLRKKDKKKALIKAMKLAGVLKKRDKSSPTYIEGGGGAPTEKQKADEAQRWKDRVFGKKKKAENVFGI